MNNITLSTAKTDKNDIAALTLFSEAFECTLKEAEGYFNTLLKNSLTLSLSFDNKKICQLFLIETDYILEKPSPIYYLYAACTDIKYRGNGYMHRLIEYAKTVVVQNGKHGIVLRPANNGLFDFYASCGFNKVLYCKSFEYAKQENYGSTRPISAEEYITIREKILKDTPHIALKKELALGLEYHYNIFGNESSICLAEKHTENGKVLIAEHLGEDLALNFALKKLNCSTATVKTVGECEPFSMLWFKDKEPQYNIYHGPCFE